MVGYMRIFMGAAKDRLESLVVSPRATTLAHVRALALVVVILVHDVAGMAALLSSVNSMSITKVRRVGDGLNKKYEPCYMNRLSFCLLPPRRCCVQLETRYNGGVNHGFLLRPAADLATFCVLFDSHKSCW